jgi:hypothetical protein
MRSNCSLLSTCTTWFKWVRSVVIEKWCHSEIPVGIEESAFSFWHTPAFSHTPWQLVSTVRRDEPFRRLDSCRFSRLPNGSRLPRARKSCALPVRVSVHAVHDPVRKIPALANFQRLHFPPPTFAQPISIRQNSFHRFPRFHSDDYYYGLYPFFKTGYSSRFEVVANSPVFAEEILRWNLASRSTIFWRN